jgi:hypothetical protein
MEAPPEKEGGFFVAVEPQKEKGGPTVYGSRNGEVVQRG